MNAVPLLLALAIAVAVPLGLRQVDPSPGAGGRDRRDGGPAPRWAAPTAAMLAALTLLVPAGGPATILVTPWVVVAAIGALAAVTRFAGDPNRLRPSVEHAVDVARGFLLVGAVFLAADRLALRPLDFPASTILLTAAHFHVAGFVLLVAGAAAWRARPARWLELGLGAVVVGIPLTALGFLGLPAAEIVGALIVAGGGIAVGLGHLVAAGRVAGPSRWLLGLAGAALLVSMPLAAAFAVAGLIGEAGPDLAFMARVHGGLNVVGFAIPAALGWQLAATAPAAAPALAVATR